MLSGYRSTPHAFCHSCVVDLARCPLSTDAVFDDNLTVEMIFGIILFAAILNWTV